MENVIEEIEDAREITSVMPDEGRQINNRLNGDLRSYESIEEIPRYKASNPFNYDNLTLAKRKTEVNAALKDYPNMPPSVIEMAWDIIQTNPKDEIDDIINNNKWANAPKKERPNAGTYKTMTIE
jgi:hypothetical protein